MVKVHTSVSIELELKEKANELNLNFSELLSNAIRAKLKPLDKDSEEFDPILEHEKVVREYYRINGSFKARPFTVLYLYDEGYSLKEIRQLMISWLGLKAHSFTLSSAQYELRVCLARRKEFESEKKGEL